MARLRRHVLQILTRSDKQGAPRIQRGALFCEPRTFVLCTKRLDLPPAVGYIPGALILKNNLRIFSMPCREIRYADPADWNAVSDWLMQRENPGSDSGSVEAKVLAILDAVRIEGDAYLAEMTRRFDCPDFTPEMLPVSEEEIACAVAEVPESDLRIIHEAAENIRTFHEAQKQQSWWQHKPDGTVLGQIVRPVDRAGLYVPGGQGGETPLISSLLMNAIPAQVAGVPEIVVISPPRRDGSLNPHILAAAHILGISKVFRAGSAWGIGALAYGTETVPAVDVIAGPGNIWVATAKRLLIGKVGIDMIAGPSEIAILTDGSEGPDCAPPSWLAADMLSQAEHDPLASSLLVTTDPIQAAAVREELRTQLEELPRSEIARTALQDWSAVVLVPSVEAGIDFINRLAPEHLELSLADPWGALGKIRNAGAIFLGASSAEPVGDYFAGPNHVLPTMGTARFSSALSVETFIKKSSLIAASSAFARESSAKIARLARLEGLEAHARSVEKRGY